MLNRKEKTVFQLLGAAALARHHLNQLLRRYNLTTTTFHLLRTLDAATTASESVYICDLAKSLAVPQPDMTRVLDRLESFGWIYRTRNAADRRQVGVHITDDGKSTVSEVQELVTAACEDLTKYFDESDMIGLSEHFKSINDAVDDCYA